MKHLKAYWYFYIVSVFLLIIILPGNIPTIQKIFQDSSAHANLLGAVIGGFLAGLVAIYTVDRQHNLAIYREEEKTITDKKAFIKSIKTELSVLEERYMNIIGNEVDSFKGVYFSGGLFKNYHGYFTYFDKNADKLGLVDEKLSAQIIKTYVIFKALFDTWIEYSQRVEYYEDSQRLARSSGPSRNDMIHFFDSIKKEHDKAKLLIKETTTLLDTFNK